MKPSDENRKYAESNDNIDLDDTLKQIEQNDMKREETAQKQTYVRLKKSMEQTKKRQKGIRLLRKTSVACTVVAVLLVGVFYMTQFDRLDLAALFGENERKADFTGVIHYVDHEEQMLYVHVEDHLTDEQTHLQTYDDSYLVHYWLHLTDSTVFMNEEGHALSHEELITGQTIRTWVDGTYEEQRTIFSEYDGQDQMIAMEEGVPHLPVEMMELVVLDAEDVLAQMNKPGEEGSYSVYVFEDGTADMQTIYQSIRVDEGKIQHLSVNENPKGSGAHYIEALNIEAFPTFVILDKDGIILKTTDMDEVQKLFEATY